MKFLILAILLSCSSFADFVYMEEDARSKSVVLQTESGRQVLNTSGADQWAIYPDISADGNEFIWSAGPGNQNLHLALFNKQKNSLKRFHLASQGLLIHAKFSRNGRYVFYSAPTASGKNTIYFFDHKNEISRQGTSMTDFSLSSAQTLDATEESFFPRPSSDAGFVVYQRNSAGKKEIVLFDRIENKKKVLAEGMSPALSYDERLIAYTSKISGNWNIYVIDRVSMKVQQMTFDEHDEMAPTFLPDNSLAFASNKSGNFRLFNMKDGKWSPLTDHGAGGVELYSPQFSGEKKFKQSELAPYLGNARSSFGTVTHQGKLYMAGGHQGAEHTYPPESFSDTFVVYDIDKNEWQELAPRPFKTHGYQLAAFGNYIYAFGGFAYSEIHKPRWKSLDAIDRYDIANNKWETIGKLNAPRSSNVAVTINDQVFLVGGWDATPQKENDYEGRFHKNIEVFDLKTEKLTVASFTMPLPLRRALTGLNYQDKIVLVGGLGQGASHFELIGNVTSLDPVTGKSTELTPMPFPTFAPAAENIGDELFVFGGMFKTGEMAYEYVSHIFALDLKKAEWRHTGRYLKETKGFSQIFALDEKTLGILGGHRYFEGHDSPVKTFETLQIK